MVQAVNVLAESRDKLVRGAGDPLLDAEGRPTARSVRLVQCLSGDAAPPFIQDTLTDAVVELLGAGGDVDATAVGRAAAVSTLAVHSAEDREWCRQRGVAQMLIFPLRDARGCCWGLLAGYTYDHSQFLREKAPARDACLVAGPLQPLSRAREAIGLEELSAFESLGRTLSAKVEMLLSLKQQARRSKRMNLQADLLSTMLGLPRFATLKGLVQAGQLSLMSVVVDVTGAAVVLPGGEVSAIGA